MASRKGLRSCVLEVERKFRSLAVPELTQHGGVPPFRSLQQLPKKTIRDIYYDRDGVLSAAGAWVRLRNSAWEAKINKGGNFINSRFEELYGAQDVGDCVRHITKRDTGDATDNFGLLQTAKFVTQRQTWKADGEFKIALDTMDFGHEVGEVELQQTLEMQEGMELSEAEKAEITQNMDKRVEEFMKKYAWAFSPGNPKGKLTAYFEKMGQAKL